MWNGTLMITGDSNIEIQKRYKRYTRYISKATQIGKKLIDHIISKIPANKILHSDVLRCPTITDYDETLYHCKYACKQIRDKIQIHKELEKL